MKLREWLAGLAKDLGEFFSSYFEDVSNRHVESVDELIDIVLRNSCKEIRCSMKEVPKELQGYVRIWGEFVTTTEHNIRIVFTFKLSDFRVGDSEGETAARAKSFVTFLQEVRLLRQRTPITTQVNYVKNDEVQPSYELDRLIAEAQSHGFLSYN